MRTRLLLTQLATLLASATCAFSLEPIELSWKQRGEWDSLLINRIEIPFTNNADTWNRFGSIGMQIGPNPIKVIIPDIPGRFPPRQPKFPGIFAQIFDSLTTPEREVTYLHKNRQLRRYLIRCSSKGTAESPDAANYWLDGVFLGTWEQAKPRFESLRWEDDAVADILFDLSDWHTASGVGLSIMPELQDIFRKHRITPNIHRHFRNANDR